MPTPRINVPDGGIIAGYNLSGSTIVKGVFVKRGTTATDEIALAEDADVDVPIGVTMEDIPTGRAGDVQRAGLALVLGSAAIAIGDKVTHTTGGKGVTTTTGGDYLGGIANTVGANNVLFEVELNLKGQVTSG